MTLSNISTPTAEPDVPGRVEHAAEKAAANPWVVRFMRFGHVVRGVIYLVMGALALRLALGIRGAEMSQTGAIEMIGEQPFGRILLVSVCVGLAGYSLWGAVCAVLDPLHEGHSLRGLAKRAGYAGSALAYAGLLVITLQFLLGPQAHIAKPHDWTAELLAKPFGAWLAGIIGLCTIAGAFFGEIMQGWRGRFAGDLDLSRRSTAERRWAMSLGRVGIVVRGIVFAIIGVFLVASALHANPHHATDTDGALLGLARQPFGLGLLAAAGLGLIAFGMFSVMCARWMKMRAAQGTR
jgi:hypothetical protein